MIGLLVSNGFDQNPDDILVEASQRPWAYAVY